MTVTLPPATTGHPPGAVLAPARALTLAAVLLAVASGIRAQERVTRTFGQEHGLTAAPVWDLAQDSLGFLWIGAEGGLFRFDGSELHRWAPKTLGTLVMDVAVAPDGGVVVLDGTGHLYRIRGHEAVEVALPWPHMDSPRRTGRMMAFDRGGTLWLRYGDAVGRLGPQGWQVMGPGTFGGEAPSGVLEASSGAFVVTSGGLWRVVPDGPAVRLLALDAAARETVADAVEPEPGRVVVLINVGSEARPRVAEVVDGVERAVPTAVPLPQSRAIAVRERQGTLWLALDRYMAAVRPGERPEILGPDEGFESGGPLLVDREGSLWLGTFVGLHQYPEPDTRVWVERHGLPSRHTRFLTRSGPSLWVMTWSGAAAVEHHDDGWSVTPAPWESLSNICTAPDGRAWTAAADGVMELQGREARVWKAVAGPLDGCAPARDGGVWLGTPGGLFHVHPQRGTVRALEAPLAAERRDPRPVLLHDSEDRLWVGAGESLCHAPASRLLAGEKGLWQCDPVASPSGIMSVVELEGGELWASAGPVGLLVFDGVRWRPTRMEDAPTQTVHALVPSPLGGVWIVGNGALARARPAENGGIAVMERLSGWHGLASSAAGHLLEERGDVWLATDRGLVHVPATVRFARPTVPVVELVEGRVDGEAVPLDAPLVLPHDQNRLELRFAALSFRHRAGLRHQVRLSPDDPWTESTGEPVFRWVDLPPGVYHAEYRASRDGRAWSRVPARFTFEVRPPWYATPWFLLLMGGLGVAVVALVHRARVGYLLELEQQRTRIAMDLHDQVGSGLASVGILSGVMAADALDAGERRRTAQEIAGMAEELGHSLSDIVWSLDPRTSSMEELATRLREHGERLFLDGGVLFQARLPERWPSVRSSVAVRRSVLLIGLEALHNAARHADARRVTLSLTPRERGAWELAVHDDGQGIDGTWESPRANGGGGSGLGLSSMEWRAEAIGARLAIESEPGRGTTVSLDFHPQGRGITDLGRRLGASARGLARMIMRRRPAP